MRVVAPLRSCRRWTIALACIGWVAAWGNSTALADQAAAAPFAKCEHPAGWNWSYADLLCLDRAGREPGRFDEARRRLRRLGAGDVEHPWPTLVLGQTTFEQNGSEAIALLEMAAEGFVRSREAGGEVLARQNLSHLYRRRGAFDAARRQVEQAVSAADASGEPLTIARASVIQANHVLAAGGDIGSAHRDLLRAERLAFPGAPIGLRRSILGALANACLYLGRLDEAIDALERHRALRQEDGSSANAATIAYDLLNTRLTMSEVRPLPGARTRLVVEAEAVLAEAESLQQPRVEAEAHRVLGDLLRTADPGRAEVHLRRCLDLEARLGHVDVRASCLWSLALHESTRNPQRAEQLSREAVSLVGAHSAGPLLAYAWQARLRLVWRTLNEDRAIAESFEALDAIERLRSGQRDDRSRAALFSNWARDYYWLAGRLLEAQPPRLAQAIDVGERLRSRVLLEYLAEAGVPRTVDPDRRAERAQLAGKISDIQRRLLRRVLDEQDRHQLLDQLALLELERGSLDEGPSAAIASNAVPFASLEAIQQSLDDREAMLWFSIAPWQDLYGDFGGGSWVVSVTRQAATIHPLPAGVELDGQVTALTGLLGNRQTAPSVWAPAARRLGRILLGHAVSQLPPQVERLVIVSDGVLHRVPFEALWADSDARRLGERFEISMAPSATVWLHLRRSRMAPVGAALVLADPEVARGSANGNLRLAPLPWARREARAIAGLLDLDPRHVLEGGAASERLLKSIPLDPFSVLHLAVHARADAEFPDRSAVFLAPGDEGEDGWVQPREIAALDLRGRLVVLSACESADGALLAGEGTLSLARAFFAAGAGAVVATRWPLRDDDAAFVMERFYRALSAGDSVGGALRRARRDAIDEGMPAASWAGVALLGDGRPRPIQRQRESPVPWPLAGVVAVALAVAAVASFRRPQSPFR